MMLGAVIGWVASVRLGLPYPAAIVAAIIVCAAFGLVVERLLVRPFASRGSNGWLMATVAGGVVLDNVVLFTFGKEPRSLPSELAVKPISIFGIGVYPLQIIIVAVVLAIAAVLSLFLGRTAKGRGLRAVVQNTDAARLMGIDVECTVVATYALSSAMAGLAGVLIAPLYNVHSDMGTLFGVKAFAVAILGGITSAAGVMIAGFAYGIGEALVTSLLGSGYTQIVMFSTVIAALALMPNGLLGKAPVKKV
jgi:branched-chain amino acid transport system permease protein